MGKFLEVLAEKDKKLEEKNQIIFALQQKVGELEVELKNMVALPLYQEEKKELILEKENLKIENKILEDKLKKEKIRNIALVGFLVSQNFYIKFYNNNLVFYKLYFFFAYYLYDLINLFQVLMTLIIL
jgi:hypothetical protein